MAKGIRARLVLELLAKGMAGRETRPARHISQRGTGLAREASERAGVTLGDVAGMPDREACGLLFPAQGEAREAYAGPGWEWVRPEPQRGGVTPGPLWEEHRDGAIRDGLAPEGHDTLRGGHRSYAGARGATNHPGHKPGQVTGVDRDGTPMWPAGEGGGVTKRHLLVATLPYSRHGYVEATPGMRQSAWPVCHARAWDFFGGVAAGTARDNPETGVASHPRGGGVAPDEAHGALGTHHVTAIMPTGVRRPRQRAGVEGTCGKVAASIAARLRNRAFRTLAGPDDATREALGAPDPAPLPEARGKSQGGVRGGRGRVPGTAAEDAVRGAPVGLRTQGGSQPPCHVWARPPPRSPRARRPEGRSQSGRPRCRGLDCRRARCHPSQARAAWAVALPHRSPAHATGARACRAGRRQDASPVPGGRAEHARRGIARPRRRADEGAGPRPRASGPRPVEALRGGGPPMSLT